MKLNAQIKDLNKILHKYDKGGMLIGEGPLTADLIDITDTGFQDSQCGIDWYHFCDHIDII